MRQFLRFTLGFFFWFTVQGCVGMHPATNPSALSIDNLVSRTNRIIAITASDMPLYRWIVTMPQDSTVISATGSYAHHEPAHISFETNWTDPDRPGGDTIALMLTDEEWQRIERWRTDWCQEPPPLWPGKSTDAFYRIAFRCSGYTAKTIRIPKEKMAPDIAILLQRSSTTTTNP